MEFLELDDVLANLAGNIVRSYDFDGYAITLWHPTEGMLVNHCAQLPARLKEIEQAMCSFRFQPNAATVSGLCFSENKAHIIDGLSVVNYSKTIQDLYQRWQFNTFAAWPIRLPLGNRKDDVVLGVFSAFLDKGVITPEVSAAIQEKLRDAASAIATAQEQEQVEVIDAVVLEQHELLRMLTASNHGDSVLSVAEPICQHLLRRYGFDMAAVILREGANLTLRHTVFKPSYAHLQETWDHFNNLCFTQDVGDGLTAVVYAQNNHFMVEDVQQISQAPFPAKDKDVLRALQTVRSYLLLPLRVAGKPVGVLWLVSLGQPVTIDKNALDTVQLIADFAGTALNKLP